MAVLILKKLPVKKAQINTFTSIMGVIAKNIP